MRNLLLIAVLAAWPPITPQAQTEAWPKVAEEQTYPKIDDSTTKEDAEEESSPEVCVNGNCNNSQETQGFRFRLFRRR